MLAASATEVAFVERNYPIAKYKSMLSKNEWQQLCYMLVRGGVFKPSAYRAKMGGLVSVYRVGENCEQTVGVIHQPART